MVCRPAVPSSRAPHPRPGPWGARPVAAWQGPVHASCQLRLPRKRHRRPACGGMPPPLLPHRRAAGGKRTRPATTGPGRGARASCSAARARTAHTARYQGLARACASPRPPPPSPQAYAPPPRRAPPPLENRDASPRPPSCIHTVSVPIYYCLKKNNKQTGSGFWTRGRRMAATGWVLLLCLVGGTCGFQLTASGAYRSAHVFDGAVAAGVCQKVHRVPNNPRSCPMCLSLCCLDLPSPARVASSWTRPPGRWGADMCSSTGRTRRRRLWSR